MLDVHVTPKTEDAHKQRHTKIRCVAPLDPFSNESGTRIEAAQSVVPKRWSLSAQNPSGLFKLNFKPRSASSQRPERINTSLLPLSPILSAFPTARVGCMAAAKGTTEASAMPPAEATSGKQSPPLSPSHSIPPSGWVRSTDLYRATQGGKQLSAADRCKVVRELSQVRVVRRGHHRSGPECFVEVITDWSCAPMEAAAPSAA